MIEKRKLTRLKLLRHLRVFDRIGFKLIGHLADIHTEGMMVISEHPQEIGVGYEIKIILPETLNNKNEIYFNAKALWCRKYFNPLFFQCGFQIQHISAVHVELIESLIDKYGFQEIFDNTAVKYYRGIEGYNCAQAILKVFQDRFGVKDDQILAAADFGGGKAEGGICGALYAIMQLMDNRGVKKQMTLAFKKEVGSIFCDEILEMGRLSCAGCIHTASHILKRMIDQ